MGLDLVDPGQVAVGGPGGAGFVGDVRPGDERGPVGDLAGQGQSAPAPTVPRPLDEIHVVVVGLNLQGPDGPLGSQLDRQRSLERQTQLPVAALGSESCADEPCGICAGRQNLHTVELEQIPRRATGGWGPGHGRDGRYEQKRGGPGPAEPEQS